MIKIDDNQCVGCSLCVPYCPEEALSCYGRVEVNEDCSDCLICIDYCPVDALKDSSEEME